MLTQRVRGCSFIVAGNSHAKERVPARCNTGGRCATRRQGLEPRSTTHPSSPKSDSDSASAPQRHSRSLPNHSPNVSTPTTGTSNRSTARPATPGTPTPSPPTPRRSLSAEPVPGRSGPNSLAHPKLSAGSLVLAASLGEYARVGFGGVFWRWSGVSVRMWAFL